MIKLDNIHVIFNQGTELENHVLKGINLTVEQGEFITVIGGNGAGKSTLMNILSGDILSQRGTILIDEKNVTKWATAKRSPLVARVFQDPLIGTFGDLSIEENLSLSYKRGQCRGLALGLKSRLRETFKQALSYLNMGLENRLKDKAGALSGGQRQALSLIMATMQTSQILLLDEHTAALDPKIARTIMEVTNTLIRTHQLTTLMITHSMSQALEYGSRTVMMYHGEIIRDMKGDNRKALSPDDLIKYFDL